MNDTSWLQRTELLIGKENSERLRSAHVLVAGLGGVGSWAAEMLVRTGIGQLTIADHDTVSPTNRNRQIIALKSTEGCMKAEVMAKRLLDINPELILHVSTVYLKDETIPQLLDAARYDYVVDAIDTLSPKIFFLYHCTKRDYPVVSSMGSGNKFDPAGICAVDISKSYNCRLAHYIRKHLHKLGVREGIKVVFSPERTPEKIIRWAEGEQNKRTIVGTISYMPAMFGLWCASVVIRDLLQIPAEQ